MCIKLMRKMIQQKLTENYYKSFTTLKTQSVKHLKTK